MLAHLTQLALAAGVGIVLRWLIIQFVIVNVHYLMNPVAKAFWEHILQHHPGSVRDCQRCAATLYNLER